ncbi:hypothetical protein HN371_15790 [Candidatus Poribacteria bacterium]|nr:hypothetical protein [Candidatus Poribacteria bacterium]
MSQTTSDGDRTIAFETAHCRLAIGGDASVRQVVDTRTGVDYCATTARAPFGRVRKGGHDWPASAASLHRDVLNVAFEGADVTAHINIEARERYFVIEVLSVTGADVDELVIVDVPLALNGAEGEPFAACALALNLQTNVVELPGANVRLKAMCYPRFGFTGAKVAIIGCPYDGLRSVMQEAVSDAPDLPHSPLGGPWALEPSVNRGSYLFNFGDLTEDTADDWIHVAHELGFDQIDFHGGRSFRFGDCRPDPTMYPDGFRSLKATVDRLHEAGISAGLHTYAHCIAKDTAWVTPVPHPGLASDAAFTLAEPLTADATTVHVAEPTETMSTITGLFSRNSVTLRVDEELITFAGVDKQAPYGFTGCTRGANGTRAVSHGAGTQAHHLLEFFGLFAPDGDSPLLAEVAAKTAEAFNTCGFDMMYLDALDAEDMMGGPENGWHYGSKFVFELWKRLDKPSVMEMSTFHHHLWFVRSRLGAWDHPRRGYKTFIDIHCASNGQAGVSAAPAVGDHGFSARRNMLPAHLGWFAPLPWDAPQQEPTLTDDVEYLCGKALGSDSSFSMMQVDPARLATSPGLPRLAAICKKYETLRRADCVPESVRAQLRAPGTEFTLAQTGDDRWQFRPANYDKYETQGLASGADTWTARNPHASQPARLRIEALMSAGDYDAPENVVLADFGAGAADWPIEGAEGVAASLEPSADVARAGAVSARYRARSDRADRSGAWSQVSREFSPALDLSGHQGIGVWVHGDARGEVLNFQVKSPESVALGAGEHYVVVDFEGWRYFELVEFEGGRCGDYVWPYSRDLYSIFRESVNFGSVGELSVWYNDLPPGEDVTCHLGAIKALPLVKGVVRNPSVAIGGDRITFPAEMEAGSYIEYTSATDCVLYGPNGEALMDVRPEGDAPNAQAGEYEVGLACDVRTGERPRARVTVVTDGEPLPEIRCS